MQTFTTTYTTSFSFSIPPKTQMIFVHTPVHIMRPKNILQILFVNVMQLSHVCTVLCRNVSEFKSLRRLQGEGELESVTPVGLNCASTSALPNQAVKHQKFNIKNMQLHSTQISQLSSNRLPSPTCPVLVLVLFCPWTMYYLKLVY